MQSPASHNYSKFPCLEDWSICFSHSLLSFSFFQRRAAFRGARESGYYLSPRMQYVPLDFIFSRAFDDVMQDSRFEGENREALNNLHFIPFSITANIFSFVLIDDHVFHPYVIAFNLMVKKRRTRPFRFDVLGISVLSNLCHSVAHQRAISGW